jgi:hypothetical protein
MSKFVQTVAIPPHVFQGDTITATLRPVKRKLFVQLLPILQEMGEIKQDTGNERDPRILTAMGRALDIIAPEFKEYVVEFKGPKDAAGVDVPLDTVLESAHFLEVALHLAMGLISTANVGEDEAGKAARLSAA